MYIEDCLLHQNTVVQKLFNRKYFIDNLFQVQHYPQNIFNSKTTVDLMGRTTENSLIREKFTCLKRYLQTHRGVQVQVICSVEVYQ